MNLSWPVKLAIALGSASIGVAVANGRPHSAKTAAAQPASSGIHAESLDFCELFEPSPELKVSSKAAALAGRHVRLVGHMVQMELAPTGGFFLTSRPLRCDEAGGGTADLPPESVLVIAHAAEGRTVPFIKGPLEVIGTFEIGNMADPSGRVSAFRIRLDPEFALPEPKALKAETTGPN